MLIPGNILKTEYSLLTDFVRGHFFAENKHSTEIFKQQRDICNPFKLT